MIWIIGGTSEARTLWESLPDRSKAVISVATQEGRDLLTEAEYSPADPSGERRARSGTAKRNREEAGSNDNIVIGRMDAEAMRRFCKERKIHKIADMSHPYALEVSTNAREVAKDGIAYRRYLREEASEDASLLSYDSVESLCAALKALSGTFFFTTGSKHIPDFEAVRGEQRFVYRVLPSVESLALCRAQHVAMQDIVAAIGPFSRRYNRCMLEEYAADYCVMKDSGRAGGTKEKLEACRDAGVTPILIRRMEEAGCSDLEAMRTWILED